MLCLFAQFGRLSRGSQSYWSWPATSFVCYSRQRFSYRLLKGYRIPYCPAERFQWPRGGCQAIPGKAGPFGQSGPIIVGQQKSFDCLFIQFSMARLE